MTYSVHAQCSACASLHALALTVEIADGAARTSSLTEAAVEYPRLGELASHLHAPVFCRRTAEHVRQRDDSKIYLVPELN